MAWRKLAVQMFNQRTDPERQATAAKRAYDLRERLPRREAELATAYYFQSTSNRPEAIQAYERMLATWPDDGVARNNLSLLLVQEGRYPDAERLLRESIDSGTTFRAVYDNLIDAQLWQRKFADAESTVARYDRAVPNAADQRRYFAYIVAFTTGQYDRASRLADSLSQSADPAWREGGASGTIRLLVLRGHLAEALRRANRMLEEAARNGARANGDLLSGEADVAFAENVLLGQPEAGAKRLEAALARYPLDSVPPRNRGYPGLINTAASLGRPDLAEKLHAEFLRTIPESERRTDGDDAWARASVALARGRWRESIEQNRLAQQRWGCPICALPDIGLAFERLNERDSALAVYQEYVNRPIYYDAGQQFYQPVVLRRLGELYEVKGDKAKALEYYGQFVDLWKNADPELQPKVKEFRRRISELAGEPKT
jgi:tetratricopeptide (TPR) repeat protein